MRSAPCGIRRRPRLRTRIKGSRGSGSRAVTRNPGLKIPPVLASSGASSICKHYVERDIARLFPGLNPIWFRRFVELLAGCSGSVINYSGLAEILAVSQPTVKDYCRIAHGTFI